MNFLSSRKARKLSGIYKTSEGDTFATVAMQACGDDTLAAVIMAANPTAFEPFAEGVVLQIPTMPGPESGLVGDELEIIVDGNTIYNVDDFSLTLSIDAISKGSFVVPNERETRAIFMPLSSPGIKIGFSGVLMMTGYCQCEPNGETLSITFESECASVERDNAPVSAYPLEFKDLNFQQITEHLCNPLGLTVVFVEAPGTRFSRVDIEQEVKVLDFLSQLAKQRNFVISSNADGQLVMWREVATGLPVAQLDVDKFPVFGKPKASINEDSYYSSVTGIVEANPRKGKRAESFTIKNPYATVRNRPYNFKANDVDDGELETCVNTVAGRMFGGVFSIDVPLASWRDGAGDFWQANSTVDYVDEDNFIPVDYEFLISEVTFNATSNEKTATLKLNMPGCYGGLLPERLPWQK